MVNGLVMTLEVELEVEEAEVEDEELAVPLPPLGGFRKGDRTC